MISDAGLFSILQQKGMSAGEGRFFSTTRKFAIVPRERCMSSVDAKMGTILNIYPDDARCEVVIYFAFYGPVHNVAQIEYRISRVDMVDFETAYAILCNAVEHVIYQVGERIRNSLWK